MNIAITKGNNGTGKWCDRPSPLGNPFRLTFEGKRDAVCDAYQEYFEAMANCADRGIFDVAAVQKLIGAIARKHGVPIALTGKTSHPLEVNRSLRTLERRFASGDAIVLKCWCINVEIKRRADLVQKKRCHCLSIAGYLLPEVGSFAEQLKLEV